MASIPLMLALTCCLFAAPAMAEQGAAVAATALRLPALGNSAEIDLPLTREVPDDHIYVPTETDLPVLPNTADAGASVVEPLLTDDSEATSGLADESAAPASDDVWGMIRAAGTIPLRDDERVLFYREQYQREAHWISKILHRGSPYLGYLVESLNARFLPIELALLPAIESGFKPDAVSAGSASGLWQIVPITAREIGIERNNWFDGRADIRISTTAAIDYLSYLNAEFNGDWELTLAAYNAGPGRVRSAIRKNRKAGKATDYWSLDLPRETLNYVPKFVGLVQLIKDPEYSGFDMPDIRREPAFEVVDVGFRISMDKAAEFSGIDEKQLRDLNAGLIHSVTPPAGPHRLLVPRDQAGMFRNRLAQVDRSRMYSLPRTHTVVAGDSISTIAHTYGISQRRLREMNSLDDSRILIGQQLAVVDARTPNDASVEYVVNIGDTLSEIAERFSVNIGNITNADGELPADVIHPGERLLIFIGGGESG